MVFGEKNENKSDVYGDNFYCADKIMPKNNENKYLKE